MGGEDRVRFEIVKPNGSKMTVRLMDIGDMQQAMNGGHMDNWEDAVRSRQVVIQHYVARICRHHLLKMPAGTQVWLVVRSRANEG